MIDKVKNGSLSVYIVEKVKSIVIMFCFALICGIIKLNYLLLLEWLFADRKCVYEKPVFSKFV